MRQAGARCPSTGRRGARARILTAIADPPLAAELTLQPVRRYGVDAAILFSDIVVPVQAIGFGVEVEQGRGPVVAEPFRGAADLARLRPFEPDVDVPLRRRGGPAGGRRTRRDGRRAHRLRRSPVHRGQLPDRGRPVADLRQGEGAHARRPGALGRS